MGYDYVYNRKSLNKSKDELYSKLDISLRHSYSNACDYLHKLCLLKEAGERVNIKKAEALCSALEQLIDKCKDI